MGASSSESRTTPRGRRLSFARLGLAPQKPSATVTGATPAPQLDAETGHAAGVPKSTPDSASAAVGRVPTASASARSGDIEAWLSSPTLPRFRATSSGREREARERESRNPRSSRRDSIRSTRSRSRDLYPFKSYSRNRKNTKQGTSRTPSVRSGTSVCTACTRSTAGTRLKDLTDRELLERAPVSRDARSSRSRLDDVDGDDTFGPGESARPCV